MRFETSSVTTDATNGSMSFVDVSSPACGALSLQVIPQHSSIGMASNMTTTQVCVNVKAIDLPDDDDEVRAGVDIIVALDVSGSMSGRKLELCKRTLKQLLTMLLPKDRFGLITYDTKAVLDLEPLKMTRANRDRALRTIQRLETRGSTNISAAIGLAAQEMKAIEEPNAVRSIFLLTDGHANHGICDTEGLVKICRNCLSHEDRMEVDYGTEQQKKPRFYPFFGKRNAQEGDSVSQGTALPTEISAPKLEVPITMNCFGYGSDHNSELLDRLATTAAGSYYFVQDDTSVATAFGDALGGIMSVVAQNAVLTLKIPTEASELGVKIVNVSHQEATLRENGNYTVNLGDFFAEETRDVVLEVQVANKARIEGSSNTVPIPHLSVTMAYTDTVQQRPVQTPEPIICFIARPKGSTVSSAHVHVTAQWVRVVVAREVKAAQMKTSQNNDLSGARADIQQLRQMIEGLDQEVRHHALVQMITGDLDEVEQGLASKCMFDGSGAHNMQMRIATYSKQRCAEPTIERQSRQVYATKKKSKYSRSMKF